MLSRVNWHPAQLNRVKEWLMLTRMERFHPALTWWSRHGELTIKVVKVILAILAWLAFNNLMGLFGGIAD